MNKNSHNSKKSAGSTNLPQLKFTMNATPSLGSRQSANNGTKQQIKLASHTGMMSSSAPTAASTSSTPVTNTTTTTNSATNKTNVANHFQQHLQLINAPTSLANLAQLSGITLVPVSKSGPTVSAVDDNTTIIDSSGNNPKQSINRANISFSSSNHTSLGGSSNTSTKIGNNNRTTGINKNISLNYIMAQPKPNEGAAGAGTGTGTGRSQSTKQMNSQQKSLANLAASMPSIQIINAHSLTTTTTSANEMTIWHTHGDSVTNGMFKGNNPTAKGTTKKTRNTKKGSKQKSVNDNNNSNNFNDDLPQYDDIPPPPVLDNAPIFDDLDDYSQLIVDSSDPNLQIEASVDSPIITIGSAEDSTSGNFNDISLLKLMAILNNPAITITPVDPQKSTASSGTNLSSNLPHSSSNLTHQVITSKMSSNSKTTNSDQQDTSCSTSMHANIGTPSRNMPVISSFRHSQFAAPNGPEVQTNWSDFITGGSINNQSATLSWVNSTQANMIPDEPIDLELENLDATDLSASVRNYILQQPSNDNNPPTVSVQLLKHIADQAKDNSWDPSLVDKSILEPECILKIPNRIFDFGKGVTIPVTEKLVSIQDLPHKNPKKPIKTTKKRLYIPLSDSEQPKIKMRVLEPEAFFKPIIIEDGQVSEQYLSVRHRILHQMSGEQDGKEQDAHKSSVEPDEIFVNRSKRVMSKIDTMLERKKRRRFERISSRAPPTSKTLEEQCDDSDAEWSDDDHPSRDHITLIDNQLPLEAIETPEKREFLSSVGLVSLNEANRIEAQNYVRKLDKTSALEAEGRFAEPDNDLKRFADAILKTGGTDVQMRIESNIKRNDLPFIEGLNRNTSRVKMTYMSVLGLEKRSKRTTLYKIKPTATEGTHNVNPLPKPTPDLKQEPVVMLIERHNEPQKPAPPTLKPPQQMQKLKPQKQTQQQNMQQAIITNVLNTIANSQSTQENRSAMISCREAIVAPPKKDEYMKSLGLMAS